MPRTATRRSLLSAAPAMALLATPAISAPAPDAHLLALADRFMAIQAKIAAYNADPDTEDGHLDPLVNAQTELLDEMDELTATTPAGHAARARVLIAWFGIRAESIDSQVDGDRVFPLLRDLMAA